MKKVAVAILGKTLLYIVAVAMTFALSGFIKSVRLKTRKAFSFALERKRHIPTERYLKIGCNNGEQISSTGKKAL